MTDAVLRSTNTLARGDVVQLAIYIPKPKNGDPFWWKSFAAVTRVRGSYDFECLRLRIDIDPRMDTVRVDLTAPLDELVVTKIEPESWPPGVVAMRTKAIMLGQVKLGDFE